MIGNNVYIATGAKIIGGVVIGDNVVIGANAVVISDCPPNTVWGGVPAKMLHNNAPGLSALEDKMGESDVDNKKNC